jgi:predicted transcriptional regulator
MIKSIKGLLKEGSRTVPEISEAVAIPTSEVLWCVMSLKKYGLVVEGEQDGAYFRYGLADSGAKGGEV